MNVGQTKMAAELRSAPDAVQRQAQELVHPLRELIAWCRSR